MLIDCCFLILFPDLDASPNSVQTRQEYGLPKGWEHDIEDEEELPAIPECLLGLRQISGDSGVPLSLFFPLKLDLRPLSDAEPVTPAEPVAR